MKYFLAKTDPDTYSVDDLEKDDETSWNGVRNPQALKFLKEMQKGDLVLIYHSEEGTVAGLARVLGNSRPDPADVKSWLVDFKFIRKFEDPRVSLQVIKKTGDFQDFRLVYQSRLSTMDVPESFIDYLKNKGLNLS